MKVKLVGAGTLFLVLVSLILPRSLVSQDDAEKEKPNIGVVIFEEGSDDERSSRIANHLHFCVFENGRNDSVYVATRWGGWNNGQFELRRDSKIIANVKVPDLTYAGVIIPLGDVFDGIPKDNGGMAGPKIYITNIRGALK